MREPIIKDPGQCLHMPDPLVDCVPGKLPHYWRVVSIEWAPEPTDRLQVRATLFHETAAITVDWISPKRPINIMRGDLVSIRWLGTPGSILGSVRVSRLVPAPCPEPETDLFKLIPNTWLNDKALAGRASILWNQLPANFRYLFNALFWDGRRFQRFVMGPSSLRNHHNELNGNLRHSVETAELAWQLAEAADRVHVPTVLVGALIHDAGKADEYLYNRHQKRFEMSPDGKLIGHRDRLLQWIGAAMAQYPIALPEEHRLGLIHALTAAKGAPAHLGLREPRSMEASILSMADRHSGEKNLIKQLALPNKGFGRYHSHLKGQPYLASNQCDDQHLQRKMRVND